MPQEIKNVTVGGATIIFNGKEIGYTEDAVAFNIAWDLLRCDKIQQKQGLHKVWRINPKITIKLNAIENTLETLKMAWSLSGNIEKTPATSKQKVGIGLDGALSSGPLEILGTAPGDTERTYYFYSVVLVEAGDLASDEYGYPKIPLTFEVLRSASEDDFGYVQEDYTPATPE